MRANPSSGAVEELLSHVRDLGAAAKKTSRFDLWVPDALTLQGAPISRDVAMAILVDQILAVGYMPDGFTATIGGRHYHYVLESEAALG